MSKESKKRNALKHGANAQEVMLWGEKYEDYECLRAGLYEEWTPRGLTEEYEVQTLTNLLWRRRRIDRYGQTTTQKRLNKLRDQNIRSQHVDNLIALSAKFSEKKSFQEVEALVATLSSLYRNTILSSYPLEKCEDPNTWGFVIAKGLSSWKPEKRFEEADEFIEIIDFETFDQELARIERLDAMIDRTIKRLMQIKTMKQMLDRLEPKLINVAASESRLPQQDLPQKRAS
jgi:hypothetical protein